MKTRKGDVVHHFSGRFGGGCSLGGAFFAAVGTTNSPIIFGVANTGDLATGVLSVSITGDNAVDSGANAVDFVATSNCLILA